MMGFLLLKGKLAIIRLLRSLAKGKKKITTKAKEFFASTGTFGRT